MLTRRPPCDVEYMRDYILPRCIEDGDCLVWTGRMYNGVPTTNRGTVRALIWQMREGPIPDGYFARCACTTARCVEHLKLQTRSEMLSEALQQSAVRAVWRAAGLKRRAAQAKLTMEKARQIRAGTNSNRETALEFGVSQTLVAVVRRGKKWVEPSPFAAPNLQFLTERKTA